jgi:hypothetical protein
MPVSSRFGSPRRPLQCVTTLRTSFDATARNRQLMARCKWFALGVFCSRRGSARGYVRQLWTCLMLATGFGSKFGSLMWTRPYTSTQCLNPEHRNLNNHCCVNIRIYKLSILKSIYKKSCKLWDTCLYYTSTCFHDANNGRETPTLTLWLCSKYDCMCTGSGLLTVAS